jgi:hypothetical protein
MQKVTSELAPLHEFEEFEVRRRLPQLDVYLRKGRVQAR